MPELSEIIKKQNSNDDIKIKDIKSISMNTKKMSENITKMRSDIKDLAKKIVGDEFLKNNQQEEEYKKRFRKPENTSPEKMVDKDKNKETSLNTKLFGAGILAGIAAYFLNDDFKKQVDKVIDNFGKVMFGDENWEIIKTNIGKAFDSIANTASQIVSSGFDAMMTKTTKIWDEHWGKITVGLLALGAVLHPFTTFKIGAAAISGLGKVLGLFEGVGAVGAVEAGGLGAAIGSGILGILMNPLVIAAVVTALTGGLLAKKYKDYKESEQKKQDDNMDSALNLPTGSSKDNRIKFNELSNDNKKKISELEALQTQYSVLEDAGESKEKLKKLQDNITAKKNEINDSKSELEKYKKLTDTSIIPKKPYKIETTGDPLLDIGNPKPTETPSNDHIKSTSPSPSKPNEEKNTPNKIPSFNVDLKKKSPEKSGGGSASNAEIAMKFFESNGFTHEQAAGIVGNLQRESGQNLDPGATNRSGNDEHYGIAQWSYARRQDFSKKYQKSIYKSTLEEQLSFMLDEMNSSEARSLKEIRSTSTPKDAAIAFENYYERSGGSAIPERVANAEKLAGGDFSGSSKSSPTQLAGTTNLPKTESGTSSGGMESLLGGLGSLGLDQKQIASLKEGSKNMMEMFSPNNLSKLFMGKNINEGSVSLADEMRNNQNKAQNMFTTSINNLVGDKTKNIPPAQPENIPNPLDLDIAKLAMAV